jgi:SH3-like domain-containing protein
MSLPTVTPAKAGVPLAEPRQRRSGIPAFAGMTMMFLATAAQAQEKQPPYWASVASGQAMTRTGPGKNYPGVWLYQRRDLPVRVVKKYQNWRLIQDPDGAQGWMLVTLLSDRRTAIVKTGAPRPVRVDPADSAKVHYRAETGVVGRIGKCRDGWCRIEIGARDGYIRTSDLWGVASNEVVD